jgi:hypothetical protein
MKAAHYCLYVQLACYLYTTVLITGDIVNGKTRIPEVSITINIISASHVHDASQRSLMHDLLESLSTAVSY